MLQKILIVILITFVAVSLSAAILNGNAGDIPVKNLPAVMSLSSYDDSGSLEAEGEISSSHPLYRQLAALLRDENTRCDRSFASYATAPFILRSPDITLRLYKNMLIVDMMTEQASRSYKCDAPNLLVDARIPD